MGKLKSPTLVSRQLWEILLLCVEPLLVPSSKPQCLDIQWTRSKIILRYMSPERICSAPYSFSSDIWSTGLVLLECATGIYPYPEEDTCIGMAQTILEADVPAPPFGASTEFVEFIAHCLHKDPCKRLPAEILLTAPWLQKHGAVSITSSVAALRVWIQGVQEPKSLV